MYIVDLSPFQFSELKAKNLSNKIKKQASANNLVCSTRAVWAYQKP